MFKSPGGGGICPVKNKIIREFDQRLEPKSVYHNVAQQYDFATGIRAQFNALCLRCVPAAINPLSHQADIAKPPEWLGYADVSTRPAL